MPSASFVAPQYTTIHPSDLPIVSADAGDAGRSCEKPTYRESRKHAQTPDD
jgi:hypothetical protein